MKPVNEGSTCTITARYRDAGGAEFTPSTARYRIRDTTNNRILLDWTSYTPASDTDDLIIPASLNAIYNDRKQYQDHAVAVQVNPGLDTQVTSEIVYKVKNLSAFK